MTLKNKNPGFGGRGRCAVSNRVLCFKCDQKATTCLMYHATFAKSIRCCFHIHPVNTGRRSHSKGACPSGTVDLREQRNRSGLTQKIRALLTTCNPAHDAHCGVAVQRIGRFGGVRVPARFTEAAETFGLRSWGKVGELCPESVK